MDSSENPSENPSDEETLEDWSQDQLRKRSQELQLIDEYGKCVSPNLEANRRTIKVVNTAATAKTVITSKQTGDEINSNDNDDGSKSASTTSDSQVENKGTLAKAVDEQ